jgi:hypothetical protein
MLQKLTTAAFTALSDVQDSILSSDIVKSATKAFVAQEAEVPNSYGIPSEIETTLGYPGDECCTLYQDDDFWVPMGRFCLNGDYNVIDMVPWGFNDRTSSYWCGKNVWYKFCYDGPGTECRWDHGESGAGHTRNPIMGHQDRLTTLYLYRYDAAT